MSIVKTVRIVPEKREPVLVTVPFKDYKDLQALVGGSFQFLEVNIEDEYYDVILNEEGKLHGLSPTIALSHKGKVFDVAVGNIYFFRANDEGQTVGLEDEDVNRIIDYFNKTNSNQAFIYNGEPLPVLEGF